MLVGALCRLGAVQNPMLPIYRYREVSFIAKQTHCSLLVTPSEWNRFDYAALAQQVAGEQPGMRTLVADHHNPTGDPATLAPPAPLSDDPADDPVRWIFYTSGTTAEPKGAQHTDRSVMAAAIGYAKKTHVVADDIALVAFPFTHVGGIIIGVFTPLLTGSDRGAHGGVDRTGVDRAHREARRHPRQRCARDPRGAARRGQGEPRGVPHDPRLPERRVVEAAGAALRPDGSGADVGGHDRGLRPHRDADPLADRHRRARRVEARRRGHTQRGRGDPARRPRSQRRSPDGAEGELVAKGPSLMRGYVDSSLDAAAFTPEGFFRTGDLARFDPHGAVVITGRLKDIIIRKGENVSAKEVEDVLFGHPKVADVAVLGLADAERGEMVCACVVPTDAADPPTLTEIFHFCKAGGPDDPEDPRTARDPRGHAPEPERQGAEARAAGRPARQRLNARIVQVSVTISGFTRLFDNDLRAVVEAARAADAAGVHQLVVPDHVVMGTRTDRYPFGKFPYGPEEPWPEPLIVLAAIAGATERVRLGTGILISPLRPAVLLAKTAATLDQVSHGRLDLGVGLGWQREEYAAEGIAFAERRVRFADQLRACVALWTREGPVSFESETVSFTDIWCEPRPAQAGGVPLSFGTAATPEMVGLMAELGAGWLPIHTTTPEELLDGLARLRAAYRDTGRDPADLHTRETLRPVIDDRGRLDGPATRAAAEPLAERGITMASVGLGRNLDDASGVARFFEDLGRAFAS